MPVVAITVCYVQSWLIETRRPSFQSVHVALANYGCIQTIIPRHFFRIINVASAIFHCKQALFQSIPFVVDCLGV